ncbi:MAG: GspE/PulE family protein, partial [Patescibacteria group bacterium]
INITPEGLAIFKEQIKNISDISSLIESSLAKKITDFLEIIIAGALQLSASDIHVEPQAEEVRVRYRLDGVLQDIASIPQKSFKFLIGRIKLISGLKLNVAERAQDGRFTIKLPDGEIEVRVSILPGPYGENIVLRILNPKSINLTIEDLGMQPEIADEIRKQLRQPNGMILTTGPTGSGKTTALYTFLKTVHTPEIKIITLEDPIEYHLPGIEQTQVSPEKHYTFASGLRSVLRQDPDVILVGEIRDLETAETAMHAALTGHLVFSTLHTNDAAGTIPRLIDIGVKPNIIAPAMNLAIAQRLLRKLCTHCKKEDHFTKEEIVAMQKELDSFPPKAKVKKPAIGPKDAKAYRPQGCEKCNNTGYKSRIGVFEIIVIDDAFEDIILKSPSEQDIKKAAYEQGQITMKQDAVIKILQGITDVAEAERTLGE